MVFIVAVKAMTDNVTYSIVVSGPKKFNFTFTDLNMTTPIVSNFTNITLRKNVLTVSKTYRLYNWGNGDF